MAVKGNSYLVADVAVLVQRDPDTPAWIVYDQQRKRFVVEPTSRAGRVRTQVGPYSLAATLWQIVQDVDTAVADLKQRLSMRG